MRSKFMLAFKNFTARISNTQRWFESEEYDFM